MMDRPPMNEALASPISPGSTMMSVPDLPSTTEFRRASSRPPTRTVSINDRDLNDQVFPTNVIRTSKYTVLTFLPINLFEQFRRIANFYFLVIICISIPPDLAPYPWYTTAMPLVFILAISGVKDGYEDFLRHREDRIANSRRFKRLVQTSTLETITSGDIAVGDVIRIDDGEEFPADLIVLLTSRHDDTCYVSTANLDGEVTPKLRIGPALDQAREGNAPSPELDLAALVGAKIESGDPTKQLDGFEGTLTLANGTQRAIGDRQVLLRGAKLRGTTYIYAVVFATGPETKLMLNRNPIRYKFSMFENVLNRCVLTSLLIELILCLFMAILFHYQNVQTLSTEDMNEMGVQRNQDMVSAVKLFVTSFILYSFLIPVSLFVTIDFVKIGQAMVIEMDEEMSIPATPDDQAEGAQRLFSTVKSSNLNDELGQIEYLFTDKTGTLTSNRMELSNVSTDGFVSQNLRLESSHDDVRVTDEEEGLLSSASSGRLMPFSLENLILWAFRNLIEGHSVDDLASVHHNQHSHNLRIANETDQFGALTDASLSSSSSTAQGMLFCMLVCNDVQPEKSGTNDITFVSSSPDEIALVDGLAHNGMRLVSAGPSQPWVIQLDALQNKTFIFKRLAQLDFSSDRRRMTVIVHDNNGSIVLFTKGASSAIEPMLSKNAANEKVLAETQRHLNGFAKLGSRTLMMASKTLEPNLADDFLKAFKAAAVQIQGREKAIEKAFAIVEVDLHLLGVTSVEDQLQEHVPETVDELLKAGITIMLLTGDMQETAVAIGRTSHIVSANSRLMKLQAETDKQCEYLLDRYIARTEGDARDVKLAMVLNGNTLETAIKFCPDKFLQLFSKCETIICNRATPSQKAYVVELITSRFKGITMAIGDGANDVSMIRKAHVGVGLIGREGRQASQSADFVLHRFSHLRRLLFIHGRYSYQRSAKVVLFSFYKNFLYPLPLFWFSFFSQFSGQTIYDSLIITNFNMFFSSLPPLIAGVVEKDVAEGALLKHPAAYKRFRESPSFTVLTFIAWLALGTYQSLVVYFVAHLFFAPTEGLLTNDGGIILGMWTFGTWIGNVAIVTVNLTFLVLTTNLTMATILSSAIGIIMYLAFLGAYCAWFPKIAPNMYGMNRYVFATPTAYLYYLMAMLLCIVPIFVSNYVTGRYWPTYATILRQFCTGTSLGAKVGSRQCCLSDHEVATGGIGKREALPSQRERASLRADYPLRTGDDQAPRLQILIEPPPRSEEHIECREPDQIMTDPAINRAT